ncbi:MAG: aminoglycoside 6'-N-acetyltransferase [Planctomycetota bacterium]|jgi:aminoglycoside 6'-N-acetyltransferase I
MTDSESLRIREATIDDRDRWLEMRFSLWPDADDPPSTLDRELQEILDGGEHSWGLKQTCFVAEAADGRLVAFLEVNLRRFADGCDTRPVGYIEGWYVEPEWRRQGVGRLLVDAAEGWARRQGCSEMASDCVLDNVVSILAHRALGYGEVHRIIHFAKKLD